MKTMKRLLAVLLCLLLSLSAVAYEGVSDWAKEEVDKADSLGILPSSLEKVPLNGAMTRLDMCRMAVNAFKKITNTQLYPAKIGHFTDTRDSDVCVAFELGIVSGYPDGTFCPTKSITRQEFAKIIENLLTALGWTQDNVTLYDFTDRKSVADWAWHGTARMVRLGVVTGGNGKLSPTKDTSIEQACAMFWRVYQSLCGGVLGPADSETDEKRNYNGISEWAYASVSQLDAMGILPDSIVNCTMTDPITRGQMCDLAMATYKAVMGKDPDIPKEIYFSDTEETSILQAYEAGIVSGFPDGTFQPDAPLTRQQFFLISNNLMNACGSLEESDADLLSYAYVDAAEIPEWAQGAMALLNRMGIMQGDQKKQVTPKAQTTCEQAIAMFVRTYDQVAEWCEAHPLEKIVGPLTEPSKATQIVELAKSFVGYPYVWAGTSPSTGFDCSGLVYYVYKQFGYTLYRSGDEMANNGTRVSEADMEPGDVLIFASKSTGLIQHVGLYIGDGLMVHAQSSSTGVVISKYDYDTGKYLYSVQRIID